MIGDSPSYFSHSKFARSRFGLEAIIEVTIGPTSPIYLRDTFPLAAQNDR
jgi:hypothetical protein